MTIEDMKASDKAVLTPAEVAQVLGVNPQSIRLADPAELGFPVVKIGTRTLIPRKPFLAFIDGGEK